MSNPRPTFPPLGTLRAFKATARLDAARASEVEGKAARQRFDHFYLALQAASDGLGVALGPLPIIADDIASGRLVAPIRGPALPSRAYCWMVPEELADDPVVRAFCNWLEVEGKVPHPQIKDRHHPA